jgi:hypothetical protein
LRARFAILLPAAIAFSLTAIPAPAAAAEPLATCFWEGPISMKRPTSRGFDGRLFNFPEESATYWMARFRLPAGSRLLLRGRFAHARYQSINAYSAGEPTDALADVQTSPDPGSVNPFAPGARRDRSRRGYTVTVLDQPRPSGARAPNTLYARTANDASIEVFYRVYEPDRGRDLDGGTGLPEPELVRANGSTARGGAACAEVNEADRSIPRQTISPALWQFGRNAPGCDGSTNPAYDPVRWERFFNIDYAQQAVLLDCTNQGRSQRLASPPAERGGFYSNRDNAYIFAHLSRKFGPVLALSARLPVVPRTYNRQRRMEAGQLRFWSLCTGESRVTLRTPDCVADRELPIDSDRRFTVVVSRAADRPANATERCGMSWIDWGDRGDGAGDPDYAVLVLRNMLPAAGFAQAVQRVQRPGTEPNVMGEQFPAAGYATKAGFEARGCSSSVLSLGRRLRVLPRGRRVRVRVSCLSYEVTCSGRLTMRWGRRLVGRARFNVRSGRTRISTFRLSKKGRKRFRRARRVVVRAAGATPAGVPVRARVGYRLRRPRR